MHDGSHVDLTAEEFRRRLTAHGHTAPEIDRLWVELLEAQPAPQDHERTLGFGPIIALSLGMLLVVVASAALVAVYWSELGSIGVLALAALYLVGYLGASEVLRRRELDAYAELLETVSIAWICLGTYAVEELLGLWPETDDVNGMPASYTAIALVGLAATLVLLRLRPTPLLIVPMAAASTALTLDLVELAYRSSLDDVGSRVVGLFLLLLGIAWITAGLWLDATRRRPYATIAHWCGLALAGWSVVTLVPKTVPGFAVIGLLGAIALFFSAFVRHWSFTIMGALGVLLATTASFGEFGRLAPIAAAAAGLVLITVGLRWSRWRDGIRAAVLARIPPRARDLVGRISP